MAPFKIINLLQFQSLDQVVGNPTTPRRNNFLTREREALAKRRRIFDKRLLQQQSFNLPNEEDLLTPAASEIGCRNAIFPSQAEALEAGFEMEQCVPGYHNFAMSFEVNVKL